MSKTKSTATPGYFLTSSEYPKSGNRPIGQNLGITIDIIDTKPCPYGTKCYRKRVWVEEYPQGGFFPKNQGKKPKDHWHIRMGAKWKDDDGPYK